jgi:ketosteroid isomerase-like protein
VDPQHTDKLLETVRAAALNREASDPQAALHALYSAVIQGDFHRFAELVTEDVELHICGFGPMDGNWRGRGDVVAATQKNFALLSGQQPRIESMISQGDRVAVLIHESGVLKADQRSYSLRGVQWFTFEGGKLKRIDEILAETAPVPR